MRSSIVLKAAACEALQAARWAERQALAAGRTAEAARRLRRRVLRLYVDVCRAFFAAGDDRQQLMLSLSFGRAAEEVEILFDGALPKGAVRAAPRLAMTRRRTEIDGMTCLSLTG